MIFLLYEGVCHEKTSTPKYSSLYGGRDFTSTSLHRDRVSPAVCTELLLFAHLYQEHMIVVYYARYQRVLSWVNHCCVHLYFMTSVEACAACYTETLLNLTGDGEFIWPWIL